jgi:hypothetical protein
MEITLPTTRAVRSIRTSKKKPIHPSNKSNTLCQQHYNKHCTPSLESHMPSTCNPAPQDTAHLTTQSQQPPQETARLTTQSQQPSGDIHDLKLLMKPLFEQLGTMLNVLNTVLSKLP